MISPGIHDFEVIRGTTLRKTFIWKPGGVPANLTGYSAKAQFRTDLNSDTVGLTLLSTTGGIILVNNKGSITMYSAPSEIASAFPTVRTHDIIHYGLQLTDTLGDVLALMEGKMTLVRSGIT